MPSPPRNSEVHSVRPRPLPFHSPCHIRARAIPAARRVRLERRAAEIRRTATRNERPVDRRWPMLKERHQAPHLHRARKIVELALRGIQDSRRPIICRKMENFRVRQRIQCLLHYLRLIMVMKSWPAPLPLPVAHILPRTQQNLKHVAICKSVRS